MSSVPDGEARAALRPEFLARPHRDVQPAAVAKDRVDGVVVRGQHFTQLSPGQGPSVGPHSLDAYSGLVQDDRAVLEAAHIALGRPDPKTVRMARIKDTLQLGRMWISEGLLPEALAHPKVTVLSDPRPVRFTREGRFAF